MRLEAAAGNWRDGAILLGECKWGTAAVVRAVVGELAAKAPRLVPGEGWQVHYALLARSGFNAAARAEAAAAQALLVDLETLDADLATAGR